MYILLHGKPTSNDLTLQLSNQHSLQVLAYVWTTRQQSHLSPTALSRGSLLLTPDQVRLWYSYGSIHTKPLFWKHTATRWLCSTYHLCFFFQHQHPLFSNPRWQLTSQCQCVKHWKSYWTYFWIGGQVSIVVILFSYIADKTGDVSVAALTYSLMGAGYLAGTVLVPVYLMKFSLNQYLLQICTH